MLLKVRAGRRQAAFADQLDDSLQLMAGSLRAGHSLLRAVDSVSQEAASPTSEEFARIVNETRVGRDLNDALDEVAARMGSEDFVWVAQAIAIHREVGGNLAEVLDAVSHTIRERNAIRRQVKALSAEGKLSAIVLMALPFGVTGFISLTNPAYLARFTESFMGYALLATAGVMLLIGGLWLKKTVKIKF
jgi:tight adherence protein B